MKKLKVFYLRNQMLVANGIANFIGVLLTTALIHGAEPFPKELFDNPIIYWTDALFTPFTFSFVFVMTLLYEKPIRHYLNALFRRTSIPQDLKLKARQRLLNEPFVLIALDFSMWVLSAIVWSTILWANDSGTQLVLRVVYNSLSIGLITSTVAFFLLEHLLQKRLAPYFFPDGGLSAIPKTLRIRIRTRLVALFFACNIVPLLSIILVLNRILGSQHEPAIAHAKLQAVININALIFIGVGICLTMLMSRNLTVPFKEIIITLQGVKNGRFDKKVQVTTNDEIGYTGDVINEMTEGLREGEVIKDAFGKYVAPEIRDEVLSGRIPLDGEKKDVTVLFSDLRDFTSMTESNDPKLVIKIMNSYFKEMAEAIQDQGGLVLQFIGDEIYAVFGAPISRPDHPARAFRAGLEMGRRLFELNSDFEKRGWPCLRHGIGINTGEAIAANIGSPDRLSYLLVGDTINIASRLQSLTKEIGNDMIISSATFNRLTESERVTAELRRLPPTTIKGKKQSVGIFAVA